MELKEYLTIIKKRILFLVIIILMCTIASATYSCYYLKPQYKSTISIFIGNTNPVTASTEDLKDFTIYQNLVQTYIEFLNKRSLAQDVIKSLHLNISTADLTFKDFCNPK